MSFSSRYSPIAVDRFVTSVHGEATLLQSARSVLQMEYAGYRGCC